MLTIPISAKTFKKSFLGGDGSLELQTDQDAWRLLADAGKPFDPSVDRVADVKVSVAGTTPLTLGAASTIKIGVSASAEAVHQISLVWPSAAADVLATARGLTPKDGELVVRLLLQGKADASAKGSAPVGPLSTTFGVAAGGSLAYERLKVYRASEPATDILADTFAGIRLPQQIDSELEIPAAGEVLVSRFGGYLTVSGQVSYGYSITGSKHVDLANLSLDLDYQLKLLAGLTASYHIAGDFEIEARRGSRSGFVRFVVKKNRQSEFNFAADFGLDAKTHLKGLPDTSDEFLAKVFGTDVESALGFFNKARTFTDVAELERMVGTLTKEGISHVSKALFDAALSNANVADVVKVMLRVAGEYNNIDARIVHLYEDSLERIPQLTQTLDLLAKVTTAEGLKSISDNEAWALINRLVGPQLYDVLLNDEDFKKFAALVRDAKEFVEDGAKDEIRKVIRGLKSAFPLNGLFEQLKGIDTPDKLRGLADSKLQALAAKLLEKTFDEIKTSDLGKSLDALHQALEKVAGFKEKYYKKAVEVANRSYAANLHFAYARASVDTALLDVEVDVRTAEGRELARLAAGGDFAQLLVRYQSGLVQINKGQLTHSVSSATQLQVNLFGYEIEHMTRVVQDSEEAFEAHDGGVLHIYTTKTQLEERKRHGGELTATTFLLGTIATALQPPATAAYLIQTLRKMSVQYDVVKEDDKTSPDEMRGVLELAELLEIVDSRSLLDQLRREFPKGFGKVSAKYVVRYDSDAVASAFQIKDDDKRTVLRQFVVKTIREFIFAKYTAMDPLSGAAPIGFAYHDPSTFALFRELGAPAFAQRSNIPVTLPAWFTKGAPHSIVLTQLHRNVLVTLYEVEANYVNRLVELDQLIDALRGGLPGAGVTNTELDKRAKEFVKMADDMSFARANTFFAVFDSLVAEGSGGKAPRSSALVLEITPPNGDTVTKFLTAAKPSPGVAPVM